MSLGNPSVPSLPTVATSTVSFFAGGDPFNVFVPGLVTLDTGTLLEAGLLLGVGSLYGGAELYPSGSGVLAYVRFLVVDTGTPQLTIQDPSVVSTVPEPAAWLLLGSGLAAIRLMRKSHPCRRTNARRR